MVPRNLKYLLLEYTAVDRFKSVGFLNQTNSLLKQTLTETNLRCIAAGFNYKPRNLAGVLIFQSEVAVRNFNKKYDVDYKGERLRYGNPGFLRMKWSTFVMHIKRNKFFMRRMNCSNSCSRQ